MPSLEFIILLVLILISAAALLLYQRIRTKPQDSFDEFRSGIQAFREDLYSLQERMDRILMGVSHDLGQVKEIGRQMQDLQTFLHSPKFRGNIGEELLRDLLEQHLPREHFSIQHTFREGQVVDAVVKVKNGLIPIDAKFPLENYRKILKAADEAERVSARRNFFQDVRRHIESVSRKYILPQEGTVDFALLYIPSEALYYELLMSESDLAEYARGKRIFLVSPNSFYYFLQTIVLGLQQQRYAEGARKVLGALSGIYQENVRLGNALRVLQRHTTNAKNSMDTASI